MKLTYIRDMSHNYMVPECEEEIQGDDYRVCMLTENRIRGLLPCTVRKQNGNIRFYYDITSRQSLAYVYGRGGMGEKELLALLRGLYYALKEVKKFLLDTAMLVLEPELIYMDVETKEPVFCYLPGFRKEITQSFSELTGYLLEHIAQTDERAVLLGYDIYRRAREENYSLEKILKGAGEETFQQAQPRGIPGHESLSQPSGGHRHESLSQPSGGYGHESLSQPSGGHRHESFSQPSGGYGHESFMQHDGGTPRGSALLWQDEPSDRDTEKTKDMTPLKASAKKAANTGTDDRRREAKAAKKSGSAKTIFLVGVVLVAVLCAAAVFLWELDTTQIGGVAFLLTGALAYGCAVESKNRKKQKAASGPQMKKQPHIPDMGALQEEVYWGGQRTGGGWEEERAAKKERRPVRTVSAPRTANKRRSLERQETAVLGDTASLPDEEETDSVAVLVSMGAEYREPVMLTDEEYIVGKLRSQADIVLDHHSISRVHAKILRRDGVYCLCDLNSTNGTFHNGRRLEVNECVPLKTGDEIAFARIGFYVGRC